MNLAQILFAVIVFGLVVAFGVPLVEEMIVDAAAELSQLKLAP